MAPGREPASSRSPGWPFAVPFVLYLAPQNYQPFRNLVPLVPFLAIGAAATLVEGVRLVGRGAHLPRAARQAGVLTLASLVGVSLFFMGVKPAIQAENNIVDSRTQTVDWLEAQARPGDRILVAQELGILPSELARIPGHVVVESATTARSSAELASYDYVVTGEFTPPAPGWVDHERRRPVATFGARAVIRDPLGHFGNAERVLIFHNPG